jgi:hypothetical protein
LGVVAVVEKRRIGMSSIDISASVGVSRSSDSTSKLRRLSGLSDRDLLSRVKDLAARERALTLEILAHLIEVERRRLHVGLGFASMFDYCTRHLRYSSSSAARRIHTARCLRDYPETYRLLEKNEVNLSTVSLVASILTRENHNDILERIRGKSQKEVEGIVADYRPPVSLRDRARPVWVAVPSSEPGGLERGIAGALSSPAFNGADTGSSAPLFSTGSGGARGSVTPVTGPADACGAGSTQGTSGCKSSRCGSEKTPNSAGGAVRFEKKRFVQFVAGERFMKKLEKARALLSNVNGNLSYEFVLEAALDEFLKDHDPEERDKRREERKQKAEASHKLENRGAKKTVGSRAEGGIGSVGCGAAEGPPRSGVKAGCGPVDGPLFRRRAGDRPASRVQREEEPSRRIPAATRDAVFARDKGRCTYVGSNGKRCETTHHLQIDHVIPYARGGANTLGNLRLLCERHNKHEEERLLGADTIRRFRRRE